MKVLILPVNIVSIPSLTAFILRLKGIDATCVSFLNSSIHESYEGTISIPAEGSLLKNPMVLFNRLKLYAVLVYYYFNADIIHWIHRIPPPLFLWKTLNLISKRKIHFVEFLGTDTRVPGKLMKINQYYKNVYSNGYEYKAFETDLIAEKLSKVFNNINAIPLLAPEMLFYNDIKMFPKSYLLFQRINLNQFRVQNSKNSNNRIIIVHSPTKEIAKGSKYVDAAITKLKTEFENIEYIKVINKTREENIEIVATCDIFLDQFIIGGYGMAATEAMAMGKPVLCYLLDELYEFGLPKDCPIVNTNPDEIYDNVKKLILDKNLRDEIGRRGRIFVEENHDAEKVCDRLIEIYKDELNGN
jgi:glycosyltransferase involved in cell wall biosynthesis